MSLDSPWKNKTHITRFVTDKLQNYIANGLINLIDTRLRLAIHEIYQPDISL